MDVYFIGVGDACDPKHGNTSILVKAGNGTSVLCDCGFSVPHSYFGLIKDPDELDMVWLSHFHGDHFFGMPLLILRFWEMGRAKPLIIASQKGVEDKVLSAMELAFPGFTSKLGYKLQFIEIEPDGPREIAGLTCRTVMTDHSQRNLGILLDDGDKTLYYSGDGRPTRKVAELILGCDIAVHEAFRFNEEIHHHGSLTGCLKLAEESHINKLALVHLDRAFRREEFANINETLADKPFVVLPEKNTHLTV